MPNALAKLTLPALAVLVLGGGMVLATVIGLPGGSQPAPAVEVQPLPLSAQVTIAGKTILLEVAKTPAEQAQGLMFRPHLAGDRGMLFQFAEPRVARFWMKNTLIPLDMIFLRDGEIKTIIQNVQPCKADPCPSYGPPAFKEVNQVLELGAGQAEALGLAIGQVLEFKPR